MDISFIDRLKNEVEIYNYDGVDNKSDLGFTLAADIEDALNHIATLTAEVERLQREADGFNRSEVAYMQGYKDGNSETLTSLKPTLDRLKRVEEAARVFVEQAKQHRSDCRQNCPDDIFDREIEQMFKALEGGRDDEPIGF
jgi:hypothetical protein